MTEELKQRAENFIIDRYKLNECYREDTEETRGYMRNDVHSQYEEEYQLYLAGATEATKELQDKLANADYQLEGRDLEIKELKEQIEKMKACYNCDNNKEEHTPEDNARCKRCKGFSEWELED